MRHLPMVALVVLLSGCQCFAPLRVSGSIQSGAVIEVQGSADALSKRAGLQHLGVYMQDGVGTKPAWLIRGSARVNSVTYGKVPPGMVEEAPAVPLEPGRKYSVGIEGDTAGTFFGPSCHGRASFTVDTAGKIIPCSEEGSACG